MKTQAEKCSTFKTLHEQGCFVIPNPWDRGSARILESFGFPALATTSSGMAWSLGMTDNHVPVEEALARIAEIANAVDVPVNADFENGFAVEPAGVHANVLKGVATGVAGLSIEDSTGDKANPLFDFALSVERIRAARRAIDESGMNVLLTGRSEGFIAGRPDRDETIKRLVAYADAGADVLYAPGLRDEADMVAVISAVAPKPVNMLVWSNFTTVDDMRRIGVRRVSIGGALARAGWTGVFESAREIAEHGTFNGLSRAMASTELEGRLSP